MRRGMNFSLFAFSSLIVKFQGVSTARGIMHELTAGFFQKIPIDSLLPISMKT
jgi:hypothetical protein